MRTNQAHMRKAQLQAFCAFENVVKDMIAGQPYVAAWDIVPQGAQWTNYLGIEIDGFGGELLHTIPKDFTNFCTGFPQGHWKRKQFWIFLISCMAYFESGFHWTEKYQEAPPPKGPGTMSAGLLQLSVGDDVHYKAPFHWKTANDVCNPRQNLSVGMRILQHWVIHDRVISGRDNHGKWLGGARYWSTLRAHGPHHSLETIQRWCNRLMSIVPDA
jgi:hypothetical protein